MSDEYEEFDEAELEAAEETEEITDEDIEEIQKKHIIKQRLEDMSGPSISLIINIAILLIMFFVIVTKTVTEKKEMTVEMKV